MLFKGCRDVICWLLMCPRSSIVEVLKVGKCLATNLISKIFVKYLMIPFLVYAIGVCYKCHYPYIPPWLYFAKYHIP